MKYLKLYWLHILFILTFIFIVFICVNDTCKNNKKQLENLSNMYNKYCNVITEEKREACDSWKIQYTNKTSGFQLYTETISNKYFPKGIIYVLIIIIPSCYFITKYFKDKIILSENNRRNYLKNLLNVFKKGYLVALIPTFILLFVFLFYYKYTGRFNIMDYEINLIPWKNISKPWIFMLIYLLNLTLTNLIYINISILISRKYHNYFISVILSFLTIVGIELFLEIVINGILCGIVFHSEFGLIFNILNAIPFNDSYGLFWPVIFSLSMNLIISFIIYLVYKDKEKLIIDCEKIVRSLYDYRMQRCYQKI